jgi:hypothetical protein
MFPTASISFQLAFHLGCNEEPTTYRLPLFSVSISSIFEV